MYYHEARYYAPWLVRWCASEPIHNEWYVIISQNENDQGALSLTASSYEYCFRLRGVSRRGLPGNQGSKAEKLTACPFAYTGPCVVIYSVFPVHFAGCNQNENKVLVSRRLNVVKIIRHMSLASSVRL